MKIKIIIILMLLTMTKISYAQDVHIDKVNKINQKWNKRFNNLDRSLLLRPISNLKLEEVRNNGDLILIKYFNLINVGIPKENLSLAITKVNDKKEMFIIYKDRGYQYVIDYSPNIKKLNDKKDLNNLIAVLNYGGVYFKNGMDIKMISDWTNIRNDFEKNKNSKKFTEEKL